MLQWTTRRASPALFLELGRHEGGVAAAVLPDGRMVTGDGGRVLVWDPAQPGAAPAGLGRDGGTVAAVAMLPDGRVVTGSDGGRVLVWDPAQPGAAPAELGRDGGPVGAVAMLPDGRVVTGSAHFVLGRDEHGAAVAMLPDGQVVTGSADFEAGRGRVLVWDPAQPGAAPAELGRHEHGVAAVAVLPDGRVVTGGSYDDRVLVWDVQSSSPGTLLACSVSALATSLSPSGARLVIGHAAGEISCWEIRAAAQNTPGAQPRCPG